MNRRIRLLVLGGCTALLLLAGRALVLGQQGQVQIDAQTIATASGTKATTKNGVVRIEWPRSDVPLKVDSMPLKPFAGLGSWAAFTAAPHGAMMMGDTVVFQDEVTPEMDAAFAGGLEVTALHNHFFYDEPEGLLHAHWRSWRRGEAGRSRQGCVGRN
jgi:hypothetical protein